MKNNTLLLGALVLGGVYLWHQHSAGAAPAPAAAGDDGLGAFMRGDTGRPIFTTAEQRPRYAPTQASIRQETLTWLQKVRRSGSLTVRTLGSFYAAHNPTYWPWIDAALIPHGFTPDYIRIAKLSIKR